MMKAFALAAATFALAPLAHAAPSAEDLAGVIVSARIQAIQSRAVINWKVGDTENMQISADTMGNLGTEVETVESDTGPALWVKETMALMSQNQVAEMLMNKADGKILEYKVNGQDQTVPDASVTVVSQDYESVTVPAGTFKCLHVVANTAQAQGLELWANPTATVMEGALKELVPTQFGMKLDIELTSFSHGQ